MKTIGKLLIFIFTILTLTVSAYATDDSPLFEAVIRGDKAEAEALLVKGANVNAKDEYGDTPLHKTVTFRHKELAEFLLAKGADVNAKTKYGWTPLHMVAFSGYKDFVELLLAKGADVNAKNEDGYTPLHRAAENGKKDVAELLLAKGADVSAKNKSGSTPLSMAAYEGNKDVAELLLAKGADVNAKDNYWWTPLHSAADRGRKDIAELLLSKGADLNAKNNHGNTPPQTAASSGQTDIVDLLKAYTLTHDRRNPRELLKHLTDQLKDSPDDKVTRSYLIKLANELKPAPAIPEEARKHFIEGTTIVKAAKNPAQQALAVQSFTEALKVAPWWGDAYYNLGVAQELAEKYDAAEKAFNFYLLTNPSETEKREVQDRIYTLAAKRKLSGAK